MNNLNDSIFEKVRANFLELSTRVLFPDPYDEIKQRIIVEYGQITQRKPQTVLKVIKGEDAKRYGEASHVYDMPGHFYRSCKHYTTDFSVEANRNYFNKNQKKKDKKRRNEEKMTSNNGGAPRGG